MLSPEYPAAVVAGNVETSQAVTNCLFGALGAHRGRAGHHEQPQLRQRAVSVLRDDLLRLAGGPGFPGTDAVHTHMTNTRLTDPEVLGVPLSGACWRTSTSAQGSGGRGKWNAGDGIRRTIRFLERMDCTILSGHRRVPPVRAGRRRGRSGRARIRCGATTAASRRCRAATRP